MLAVYYQQGGFMNRTSLRAFALLFLLFFCSFAAASGININTASAEEIATSLTGIGPAKAQAIVEYRESRGRFVSIEELAQVRGIGQATVDRNRELITIGDEVAAVEE